MIFFRRSAFRPSVFPSPVHGRGWRGTSRVRVLGMPSPPAPLPLGGRGEFPPSAVRRPLRRGVLLLVILGLLAMFGLVAVTFVITAGHFRRSSQALHRLDQYRDDPKSLLDEAFAQCVRGSNNVGSVIGPAQPAGRYVRLRHADELYRHQLDLQFSAHTGTTSPPKYAGQFFRFMAQTSLPGTTPRFPCRPLCSDHFFNDAASGYSSTADTPSSARARSLPSITAAVPA